MALWCMCLLVQGKFSTCVCECMRLEPHAPPGLYVRAGLFSVQLLAGAQHPPWAQMLAHRPPQPYSASIASHLSLAVSLYGWPAGVENQPLVGLWGLEEGTAGVV